MKVNDIIRFDNKNYRVLDIIENKNKKYAYLINNEKYINDISIVEVSENDKKLEVKHIKNIDEFNYVLCRLYLKNKNEILSYFE